MPRPLAPSKSRPNASEEAPEHKPMQVLVRDNNIDQALRVLKKKMQREGVLREMKRRRFCEKPSEQAEREIKNERRKSHQELCGAARALKSNDTHIAQAAA
jgi:small subunit ribosomal protein S21